MSIVYHMYWSVSSLRCSEYEIEIFDSLYKSVDTDVVLSIFETNGKPNIKMAEMCRQVGMFKSILDNVWP